MAGKAPAIYLDVCIFISIVTREARKGDESAQIAGLVTAIEKKEIIPVTSALTRTEVLRCNLDVQQKVVLQRLLAPPKIQVKDVTSSVIDLATDIREFYQNLRLSQSSNLPTLETPDAIHVATAIIYRCAMMFTFDEADRESGRQPKRGLIPLSGTIAGRYPMQICKPFIRSPGLQV